MINASIRPRNIINDLPMETLCEIFSRCMDQSLARVLMQPNTRIAPMLLCHVCASWRAVVLAAPRFWSRLRFNLPLDWHFKEGPYPWDRERFARRLEWLSWWRGNLGALAPYLQVELRHGGVDRSPLGLRQDTSILASLTDPYSRVLKY
jgi:hypothetical protein